MFCMMAGTPAITITLPSMKPGAFEMSLRIRSAPSGMRAMRRRASFRSSGLIRCSSISIARGSSPIGTPKALATLSAVMSSWVGPMPPVVKR